ncbi:hypothetical protein KDA_76410 [Dictyobacter alpinus]|uniref:Tyrosine recombinase XerC n=1 Tax=Dictyobacter alpinus TaxID=2014873 RepID=A0A402BLC3_9CHLR|nr:tyrosine-type recombinase/integrase [Dictyobacter alpinus]GCE32157.1 hypothetical protein KDA_76410 [Dictyobacter alpinus]
MSDHARAEIIQLDHFGSRKKSSVLKEQITTLEDDLFAWMAAYLDLAVEGVRSRPIADKIALHLDRFADFFLRRYGHLRISTVLKRDVLEWMKRLRDEETEAGEHTALAPATVNNHLASLSGFTSWVAAQRPELFVLGNPCSGVKELPLPALIPHTLSEAQVISLKSILERLPALMRRKGRRHGQRQRKQAQEPLLHKHSRPYRDRAIIEIFLACGVRREELVNLNLDQVVIGAADPNRGERTVVTPAALRKARKVQLVNVYGKNQTLRNLFLSADARAALADYLECERGTDAEGVAEPRALFLRAGSIRFVKKSKQEDEVIAPQGDANGRLTVRAINKLVTHIGELHDAEQEGERKINGLHPHMLRHTFGFRLAEETNKDKFELQRRLGHQSEAYIRVYTTPTENIASGYVEKF